MDVFHLFFPRPRTFSTSITGCGNYCIGTSNVSPLTLDNSSALAPILVKLRRYVKHNADIC